MDPRLRKALHRANVSVTKFDQSVEARRPRIIAAAGVDFVIDVGANVGQYATQLRGAGFQGQILSIEPVHQAFQALSRKAFQDPAWDVRHGAVGREAAEVTMNVSSRSIHSSVLPVRPEYTAVDAGAAYVRREVVACDTLDAIVQESVPSEAHLGVKIDVQGMEAAVLDGGSSTLQRARILEMEFLSAPSYEGETLAPELLARVFDLGFKLVLTENLLMDPLTGRSVAFNGVFTR